jgi:hypothetical protein
VASSRTHVHVPAQTCSQTICPPTACSFVNKAQVEQTFLLSNTLKSFVRETSYISVDMRNRHGLVMGVNMEMIGWKGRSRHEPVSTRLPELWYSNSASTHRGLKDLQSAMMVRVAR